MGEIRVLEKLHKALDALYDVLDSRPTMRFQGKRDWEFLSKKAGFTAKQVGRFVGVLVAFGIVVSSTDEDVYRVSHPQISHRFDALALFWPFCEGQSELLHHGRRT